MSEDDTSNLILEFRSFHRCYPGRPLPDLLIIQKLIEFASQLPVLFPEILDQDPNMEKANG
jgi:hypothetical protein